MRVLLALVVFSAASLQGQERKPVEECARQRQAVLTDSYYHAVLERALRAPNWQTSLITISVSTSGSESKLTLREQAGKFELLRGSAQKNVHEFIANLDAHCRLPANPIDAAERVKVNWEIVQLPPAKFEQMHRDLTYAISQQASNIQARYATLLVTRATFLNLHVPQYTIVYDNKFEHIEIRTDDTTSDPSKMDPVVRWTHAVLNLSGESFRKR